MDFPLVVTIRLIRSAIAGSKVKVVRMMHLHQFYSFSDVYASSSDTPFPDKMRQWHRQNKLASWNRGSQRK
jgi:hypothetical protein